MKLCLISLLVLAHLNSALTTHHYDSQLAYGFTTTDSREEGFQEATDSVETTLAGAATNKSTTENFATTANTNKALMESRTHNISIQVPTSTESKIWVKEMTTMSAMAKEEVYTTSPPPTEETTVTEVELTTESPATTEVELTGVMTTPTVEEVSATSPPPTEVATTAQGVELTTESPATTEVELTGSLTTNTTADLVKFTTQTPIPTNVTTVVGTSTTVGISEPSDSKIHTPQVTEALTEATATEMTPPTDMVTITTGDASSIRSSLPFSLILLFSHLLSRV